MNTKGGLMKIGDLARHAGVSHRTIHYYENIGLLAPAEREGGGYRYYNEESLRRLHKIATLKNLGLNLDEIASVIDLYFKDVTGLEGKQKVVAILEKHLEDVDRRMADLGAFRAEIQANIKRLNGLIVKAQRGEPWG